MKVMMGALVALGVFSPCATAMKADACIVALTGTWTTQTTGSKSYDTNRYSDDGSYWVSHNDRKMEVAGTWGANTGQAETDCTLVVIIAKEAISQNVVMGDRKFARGQIVFHRSN